MKRKYLAITLILAMVIGFAMIGTGVVSALSQTSNQLTYTTVVKDTSLFVSSTYSGGELDSGEAYQFNVKIENNTANAYDNVQVRLQILCSGIAGDDVTLQYKDGATWQPCTATAGTTNVLQYDCPAAFSSIASGGSETIQYKVTYNTAGTYNVKILTVTP